MGKDRVKLGFVGTGNMGQCAHLKNYVVLPDCEVTAIAELREKTGQAVAARYGIPRVYKDHTEMLAYENVDGIVASQPFSRHGLLLKDLLKTGLPIFIEKPLAASIAAGEQILEDLAASKSVVMVGYHKRCDPAITYAREQISALKATGELGPLRYVRILMPEGDWVAEGFRGRIDGGDPLAELEHDPPDLDMDNGQRKEYGTFVNYYIHQVNLMRYLLGEPYQPVFTDRAGILLVGESDSGLTCSIEMTPYKTSVDWQEQVLVAFERGYIKVELPAPLASNRAGTVEVLKDPGNGAVPQVIKPHLRWDHAMLRQAQRFVSVVKGEAEPACGAAEALDDLKVAREYMELLWKTRSGSLTIV